MSPDSLIREYETLTHFRTYAFERDPSFSANFNVLIALLHVSDPAKYCPQIEKCARFLCKLAWETDGFVRDKWACLSINIATGLFRDSTDRLQNLSRYYSIMLMVQAFTDLLELWSNGPLSAIPDDLIRDRAYILLFQSVHRIMLSQEDDGSWNHSREETSYAICTLLKASTLPFWELFASELKLAIARGREFLQSSPADKPGYLWIAKVTYASDVLSESYVLAALRTPTALHRIRTGSLEPSEHTISRIENYIPFYRQTPLLASVPEWQLRASLFEGYLFQPALRRRRLDVFPRKNMPEDKYFEYIPFTWTGCSNRNRTFASADFLFEMMVLSFLNYQADEHMEAAGRRYAGDLSGLSQMIDEVFQRPAAGEADTTEDDIRGPLTKFVRYFLTHPRVLQASEFDRASLRRELKRYLLAQVAQTEDSRLLQETRQGKTATTWESFFHWVRSTAADNSSCPYAFASVACFLGDKDRDCFEGAEEKFIASDVGQHLASMCRMYNDFGSVARDREDQNLNSIDFPEFADNHTDQDERTAKEVLFRLAQYEQSCLDAAMARLDKLCRDDARKRRKLDIFRVFCSATDLYGQIYVVRDISVRRSMNE